MANFEKGPKIVGQPDFFEGENVRPIRPVLAEELPVSKLAGSEIKDYYICPECENTNRSCAHCHGRNYGYVPNE